MLIVILVFLQNFRATLVPATTVPVTIIGAFAGMAALGYTVNLSTLFGIVLAIGIVVDDAIVIVEGVSKYIERGLSGHDAAIKAMDELFGPIIGITLVLMAVFLPAAFVPGLTGNMFAQFALVIAVTALISAINAATLKPTQCALWLREPVPPEKRNFIFRAFNAVYDPMERRYAGLIGRMVRRSRLMVVIALVVSGARFLGLGAPAHGLHPHRRPGLSARRRAIARRRGARPDQGVARRRSPRSRAQNPGRGGGDRDRRHVAARQQRRPVQRRRLPRSCSSRSTSGSRPRTRTFFRSTRTCRRRSASLPDGKAFVLPPPPIQGIGNAGGFQMQLELLGGSFDFQKLGNLTEAIVAAANKDPALRNVLTTFRNDAPHIALTVDRDRAQTLRVSVGDVFATLTDYVGSTYVNQFNKFGLSLQVYVQADSQFRLHPEDLLNLYVRSQDGAMVPIGSVAPSGIDRRAGADHARTISIRPRPSSAGRRPASVRGRPWTPWRPSPSKSCPPT